MQEFNLFYTLVTILIVFGALQATAGALVSIPSLSIVRYPQSSSETRPKDAGCPIWRRWKTMTSAVQPSRCSRRCSTW